MGEAINYDDYTVAWMCFDELVETALLLMFDDEHGTIRSSRSKLKDVIQQFNSAEHPSSALLFTFATPI